MGEEGSQRVGAKADEAGRERRAGRNGAEAVTVPARARAVLRLQASAGNLAVARAVKHAPKAKQARIPIDGGGGGGNHSGAAPGGPEHGPPMEASENAIVGQTKDPVKLHAQPKESAKVVDRLRMNDRLFLGPKTGNWRFATTSSGHYGYLAEWLVGGIVKTDLPDPLSSLHLVAPGETALGIANRAYGHLVKPGQDLRFYVNVLEYVNRGPGQRGIYQPNPSDTSTGAWKNVKARAGVLIWIPSDRFAESLRGVVKSGSITGGLWAKARGAIEEVADFAIGGAAFVAGLFSGALDALKGVLSGAASLMKTIWQLLTGQIGVLLRSAVSLFDAIKSLKVSEVVEDWVANFKKRWGDKDIWSRWKFRGWVGGFAIAEIALMYFTGGIGAIASGAAKAVAVMGRMGRMAAALLRKAPEVVDVVKSFGRGTKTAVEAGKAGDAAALAVRALISQLERLGLPRTWLGRLDHRHLEVTRAALGKWNYNGARGMNQGALHVVRYAMGLEGRDKLARLGVLADRTGLGPFELTDPALVEKVTNALNEIRGRPHHKVKEVGGKAIYWIPADGTPAAAGAAPANSARGILIVMRGGKYDTFFPSNFKGFHKAT